MRTYEFFEDAKIKYPTASLNINKVMERFNIRPALPSNSNDSTEKDFPRKISVWEEVWEDKI